MTAELLNGIAQAAKELPPKVIPKLRVAWVQNGREEAEPGWLLQPPLSRIPLLSSAAPSGGEPGP